MTTIILGQKWISFLHFFYNGKCKWITYAIASPSHCWLAPCYSTSKVAYCFRLLVNILLLKCNWLWILEYLMLFCWWISCLHFIHDWFLIEFTLHCRLLITMPRKVLWRTSMLRNHQRKSVKQCRRRWLRDELPFIRLEIFEMLPRFWCVLYPTFMGFGLL